MRKIIAFLVLFFPGVLFAQTNYFQLKKGDQFYVLLKRHGFTSQEIYKLLNKNQAVQSFMLSQEIPYSVIRKGTELKIEFYDGLRDKKLVFWRKSLKKVGWANERMNYDIKTIRFKGHVNGSLIGSIVSLGQSEMLARDFIDIFRLQLNPDAIKRGAQFDLLVEKKLTAGRFIKFGRILYASIKGSKGNLSKRIVEYKDGFVHVGPEDEFFNKPLYLPVPRVRVSSLFQAYRMHPITHRRQAHLGIDFDFPEGENIYSAQSGVVLKVGYGKRSGRFVVIRHSNGFESAYSHLSYISPKVKPGLKISAGGLVGFIGTTGQSTQPHLHFGLKKNGKLVDPIKFLRNYPAIAESRVKRTIVAR